MNRYLLAFDTSNEVIAIGIARVDAETQAFETVATREIPAHRASNTQLLPTIDRLIREHGIPKSQIACVVCGKGPGSFTGVRICMATAKGVASALDVGLYGISTLDVIAAQLHNAGYRGEGLVVADAMRKEVYPVRFNLTEEEPVRLEADSVAKADSLAVNKSYAWIAGDGLRKYADVFENQGSFADDYLWTPTGQGLLLVAQSCMKEGSIKLNDPLHGNPALALPVYTRLSDAEENERIRLSKNDEKNLTSGVQAEGVRRDQQAKKNDTAIINAKADDSGIVYRPLDAAHVSDVAALEQNLMGTDAWSEASVADELPRTDRIWWAAYSEAPQDIHFSTISCGLEVEPQLIAYVGGWVIDGELQILKIATLPEFRHRGIARSLLAYVAADAHALGARKCSLEVRLSNTGAQAFYERIGLSKRGLRPRYYSDREDAVIMGGPLPLAGADVAGMEIKHLEQERQEDFALSSEADESAPLADEKDENTKPSQMILAIESSCDETAAAVIDEKGTLLADVLASQIDFHARFGGVVPEIASRKHIEAICGVTSVALQSAAEKLQIPQLRWRDLSAVAVTYAPGLVGALVVGVAFAKGAAWGADLPFIGVNHLEGHIYANKIATPDIKPPMVVSLVSGGHTMLVHVKDWGVYETLGSTLDDAVGEAFDKVAKAMGLGYPGGPAISKLALDGDAHAIDFPRAMLHSGDLQFSLSGLKTAVITYLNRAESLGEELNKADVAASFQQAVIDVQVAKAKTALQQTGAKEFCLGGGVAANSALREAYEKMCAQIGVRLTLPPLSACTDNAGMIALVALDRFKQEKFFDLDADAFAQAKLDLPY
ncbi:MAG: tRNA (adenosine(37)-N6)-threonylcarbamoyltransferase complex transferase subunit TsaD [Raoultibacter sp.]|jgi:N6-L-threonylcarbamoyladenine synthase/protein kinase Bud32